MKRENTSKRLKQIMNNQNLKQIDILNKCKPVCDKYNKNYNLNIKVSKSDLSQWLSGIYEPSSSKLSVLAEALNINEVWLMGFDVPMDADWPTTTNKLKTNERKYKSGDIEIIIAHDGELDDSDIFEINNILLKEKELQNSSEEKK